MKFATFLRTFWCHLLLTVSFLCLSAAEEPFKCPEHFGYYPDLKDCSKYYVCVFGDSLHEKCTGGLYFSVELQTCDWPRNVDCTNVVNKPDSASSSVDFNDEDDDEVFSSSRRTPGGRNRSPNQEAVSNYQQDGKDDTRDYSRSRSRASSVTSRPDGSYKQSQATAAPPPLPRPNSNPTTLPVNEPSTVAEDPLYLSDERSKVSDPLGNYDPQQPDFDEAAPPLIDSEGGIHIADGGHGLDAFAGLAHLPGLGDYSVIAKPIYNANSGTSDQADDGDYSPRKPSNPNPSRAQPASTKPRSLESFQSGSGRSKDPDVVIDYSNDNKNIQWNYQKDQKTYNTPPPTIFDDNTGHRDYGGFDVITPLKSNIQSEHTPSGDRGVADNKELQNSRTYNSGKTQSSDFGSTREVQRLNTDNRPNVGRTPNRNSYTDTDNGPRHQKSENSDAPFQAENQEFSRLLKTNYNPENQRDQNRNTEYGALGIYRAAKDEIINRHNSQYQSSNQHEKDGFDHLRTNTNRNSNNPGEISETSGDNTYRRQPELERNIHPEVSIAGEPLDANFGIYTGNQRQNRKFEIDAIVANQNIENSKGIIPAESIQPAVRQPNQIINDNNQKTPKNEDSDYGGQDPSYRDEYDEIPRSFGEYDSPKPQYPDDYYTNQDEQETTPRPSSRNRPTRPRKPLTTTTSTTTTTTPAPIRVRSRRPISDVTPLPKQNYQATTPLAFPSRPLSVYPTPPPYSTAQKCDPRKCRLPDCRCGGTEIPNNLQPNEIPQIVILTFDDAVNDLNHDLYDELFNTGRANPNGCPILGTFYVSHEWTDYGQVQTLYSRGHEIASHSITHSYGEKFSKNQWVREIEGQREILHLYGGVKMEDIRGMRAPFLQIGGNKMFEMLFDGNFTYDSSMPVYENTPPFWPYTLDYGSNHECMIFPCPSKTYPGMWEIGMVMWVDLRGGRCSMGDACSNPPDEEAVTKMLMKNFNRHYKTNRAPFGLFYHSAWFNTQHHRRGFMKFLDEILKNDDVYFVTNWQLIQWMRDPVPLSKIKNFEPFNCRRLDRPPPCPSPTVCNVWYQGGVRYMKTCQPCPLKYPWIGNTGYDVKNRG